MEKREKKQLIVLVLLIGLFFTICFYTFMYKVIAYLSKPLPSTALGMKLEERKATIANHPAPTLPYKIVERKDVSYLGCHRMVYRVIVDVNTIPADNQLKQVAMEIWKPTLGTWKEFTVFMYLPEMDAFSVAYAVAEFRSKSLVSFKVQDYALQLQ